ncbi:MAG: hypothetical protein IPL26_16210 [Leptospiraceae bacterium]|nr:hypothetical protein [Leptospiraceae bacterium]
MGNGGWTMVGYESGIKGSTANYGALRYLNVDNAKCQSGTCRVDEPDRYDYDYGLALTSPNSIYQGLIGRRFEKSDTRPRMYDYVRISDDKSALAEFKLSDSNTQIFINSKNQNIPVDEFKAADPTLATLIPQGNGKAKFCRASYSNHVAWDNKNTVIHL